MASSRQPAGSEGELARGGEQKNVCIIKIIKTLIFTADPGYTSESREKSQQLNWLLLTLFFLAASLNGVFLDGGVIVERARSVFFVHLTLK